MIIAIPEAKRAVSRIYQFPGRAHLKKTEIMPAITMTHKWWAFLI
jgi:hypothetical protein